MNFYKFRCLTFVVHLLLFLCPCCCDPEEEMRTIENVANKADLAMNSTSTNYDSLLHPSYMSYIVVASPTNKNEYIECIGTLIHPKFVLTAADCVLTKHIPSSKKSADYVNEQSIIPAHHKMKYQSIDIAGKLSSEKSEILTVVNDVKVFIGIESNISYYQNLLQDSNEDIASIIRSSRSTSISTSTSTSSKPLPAAGITTPKEESCAFDGDIPKSEVRDITSIHLHPNLGMVIGFNSAYTTNSTEVKESTKGKIIYKKTNRDEKVFNRLSIVNDLIEDNLALLELDTPVYSIDPVPLNIYTLPSEFTDVYEYEGIIYDKDTVNFAKSTVKLASIDECTNSSMNYLNQVLGGLDKLRNNYTYSRKEIRARRRRVKHHVNSRYYDDEAKEFCGSKGKTFSFSSIKKKNKKSRPKRLNLPGTPIFSSYPKGKATRMKGDNQKVVPTTFQFGINLNSDRPRWESIKTNITTRLNQSSELNSTKKSLSAYYTSIPAATAWLYPFLYPDSIIYNVSFTIYKETNIQEEENTTTFTEIGNLKNNLEEGFIFSSEEIEQIEFEVEKDILPEFFPPLGLEEAELESDNQLHLDSQDQLTKRLQNNKTISNFVDGNSEKGIRKSTKFHYYNNATSLNLTQKTNLTSPEPSSPKCSKIVVLSLPFDPARTPQEQLLEHVERLTLATNSIVCTATILGLKSCKKYASYTKRRNLEICEEVYNKLNNEELGKKSKLIKSKFKQCKTQATTQAILDKEVCKNMVTDRTKILKERMKQVSESTNITELSLQELRINMKKFEYLSKHI